MVAKVALLLLLVALALFVCLAEARKHHHHHHRHHRHHRQGVCEGEKAQEYEACCGEMPDLEDCLALIKELTMAGTDESTISELRAKLSPLAEDDDDEGRRQALKELREELHQSDSVDSVDLEETGTDEDEGTETASEETHTAQHEEKLYTRVSKYLDGLFPLGQESQVWEEFSTKALALSKDAHSAFNYAHLAFFMVLNKLSLEEEADPDLLAGLEKISKEAEDGRVAVEAQRNKYMSPFVSMGAILPLSLKAGCMLDDSCVSLKQEVRKTKEKLQHTTLLVCKAMKSNLSPLVADFTEQVKSTQTAHSASKSWTADIEKAFEDTLASLEEVASQLSAADCDKDVPEQLSGLDAAIDALMEAPYCG
eukprot:gnl/Hemi2/23820_TR7992_c0_g1_i1.p1 gnl/Hemi2/23820_TR7992_c0_g1~~gnl/Hemi2/23820_TR7992_c0_g1_i1.p1  ORF type:complete len:367 (-),score=108.49 gnl/Hemi2/23820_TR7992_c0_g1_i1:191-1291(-)